jgi:hypothetical protein
MRQCRARVAATARPPDPNGAWADIPRADLLSSTGRATWHLTSEVWLGRVDFAVDGTPVDGTLAWNVDNYASIWVNGVQVVNQSGTYGSVTTTAISAALLHPEDQPDIRARRSKQMAHRI